MSRFAGALVTVALAGALALAGASAASAAPVAASAATPGVSATCSTLTVKPQGFADKGELRVVVDGEVQTDGSAQKDASGDDWSVFTGSYAGVYAFDPRVAHRYSIQINSFAADSAGRTFSSGTGSDSTWSGTTTPCDPVSLRVAATNCISPGSAAKQGLDLTIGELRRSTTYLVEVMTDGAVVTHFQFRTQPEVTKHFSGLVAGTDYLVRVTDQSDDELSTSQHITIPGCASAIDLDASVALCTSGTGTTPITADLGDLVVGRGYQVALTSDGSSQQLPVVSMRGDDRSHSVRFAGLAPGSYRVAVSDDAAPRTTRSGSLTVTSCSTGMGDSATGGVSAGGVAGADTRGGAGGSASTATQLKTLALTVTADGAPVDIADSASGSAAQPKVGAPTATLARTADAGPLVIAGIAILAALLLLAAIVIWIVRRRRNGGAEAATP